MARVSAPLYYSEPLTPTGPIDDWVIDGVTRPPETIWNFQQVGVATPITDLREADLVPRLDAMGFERVVSPTRVDAQSLADEAPAALEAYQAEMRPLLTALTGADAVVFFDATFRHEDPDAGRAPAMRPAHLRVHVDQNPRSARARATHHGGPDRAFRRFQIVNLWRPLLAPVRNFPLALCDYRSLDLATDLVPTRLNFPPWLKDRENYSLRFNARHRWYYWSALSPDEALVFKCYDSASRGLALASGATAHDPLDVAGLDLAADDNPLDVAGLDNLLDVAGLCPHSAFFDEQGPTTGRLRLSLELRALLFYD